jgi:hypothetical protein
MAIQALSTQDFDRLHTARTTLAQRLTAEAVEWFVDDTRAILGAIAPDRLDLNWSIVILGRDTYGRFRALDGDNGIGDLENARQRLVRHMATVLAAVKTDSVPLATD